MAETALNTKRKKAGLLLTGNYNWAGGLYYTLNIIRSLRSLDDRDQPFIVIFYNRETPRELLKEIDYPYAQLHNLDSPSLPYKIAHRTLRSVTGRNFRVEKAVNPYHLDVLYPMTAYFSNLKKLNCNIVYWMYDFQHKFLPEFFSRKELLKREKTFREMAENAGKIIVSSKNAAAHFRQFYQTSAAKVNVLHFVSIIDEDKIPGVEEVKKKFNFEANYWLVSNQFWQHKNHLLVLKALARLKKSGITSKIVFTGRQHDHRNADYFNSLQRFIHEKQLGGQVIFTDFIPRGEQLALMRHCRAVIQPSLFEGWSTVIEDAKTLNVPVMASALDVHREQLGKEGIFFDPKDDAQLAALMSESINQPLSRPAADQKNRIKEFAQNFIASVLS